MRYFGYTLRAEFAETTDVERLQTVSDWLGKAQEPELWRRFDQCKDEEFPPSDRQFICRIMKVDPRDRPTARELLQDPWLDEPDLDTESTA